MLTSEKFIFYTFTIHTVEPLKIIVILFMLYRIKLAGEVGIEPTMSFDDGLTVRCITSLRIRQNKLTNFVGCID